MRYKRLTERSGEHTYSVEAPPERKESVLLERLGELEDMLERDQLRLVTKAHWVVENKIITHEGCIECSTIYRCSKCGRVESEKEPFCHCGADMRRD